MYTYLLTAILVFFIFINCLFAQDGTGAVHGASPEENIRPLAGIAGIINNSPRTVGLSLILEGHLSNMIYSTGLFSIVDMNMLKTELKKFNCLEEKCVLRFASNAKIRLLIMGEMDDRGDYINLRLSAYGTGRPYYGRMFVNYEVDIPMSGGYTAKEYSYIFEEHTGFFAAKIFSSYVTPVPLIFNNGKLKAAGNVTGTFRVYRSQSGRGDRAPGKKTGTVTLVNGRVESKTTALKEGDYIFRDYKERANFFNEFYRGRKKEIVFERPSVTTTIYKVLFTAPASAVMPVLAPTLGYYRYSDWAGLALWTQCLPYLYLEYDGLVNKDLSKIREKQGAISSDDKARYYFGWYMLLAGGTSMFVDAFSNHYLNEASKFRSMQPVMGNPYSAGYLALVSGGAGHFYRGSRFWGYFYFHVDNVLLYLAMREFFRPERYDAAAGKYIRGEADYKRGLVYAGALGIVKTIEIIHAVCMKDRIRNGNVIEEKILIDPEVYADSDGGVGVGFSARKRF